MRTPLRAALALLLVVATACGGGSGGGSTIAPPLDPPVTQPDPPVVDAGPVAMRRLTESQYRATVADVLGEELWQGGELPRL